MRQRSGGVRSGGNAELEEASTAGEAPAQPLVVQYDGGVTCLLAVVLVLAVVSVVLAALAYASARSLEHKFDALLAANGTSLGEAAVTDSHFAVMRGAVEAFRKRQQP